MSTMCTFETGNAVVLPGEYQPYVNLLEKGLDMQTSEIIAAYARPA